MFCLFYSNHCAFSQKCLHDMARYPKEVLAQIHFVCIDRRQKNPQGQIVAILENNVHIPVPSGVTRVPALHHTETQRTFFGNDIQRCFEQPVQHAQQQATRQNLEPEAFDLSSLGGAGSSVASDHYAFIDQSCVCGPEHNDGARQMHHYVSVSGSPNPAPAPAPATATAPANASRSQPQPMYQQPQPSQQPAFQPNTFTPGQLPSYNVSQEQTLRGATKGQSSANEHAVVSDSAAQLQLLQSMREQELQQIIKQQPRHI